MAHPDRGRALLMAVGDKLKDHGVIERMPLLEGRQMIMVMNPVRAPQIQNAPGGGAPIAAPSAPAPLARPAVPAMPPTTAPPAAPVPAARPAAAAPARPAPTRPATGNRVH